MDFIEGIGQSYFQRKAYAVPQQLENLAKKQFAGGDAAAAATGAAKPDSATQNDGGKDKEIEKLRRELAETKQIRGKPAVKKDAADGGKGKEIEKLRREIAETKRSKGKTEKENIVADGKALANKKAAKAFQASQSPEKSKSTSKHSTKPSSKPHDGHAKQQDAMHERQAAEAAEAAEAKSRRGRPSSAKTATAAKKPALDFQKQHHKTEKNHQSHSKDKIHHTTAPTPQYPPATTPGTTVHRIETVTKRPKRAADICLVEVIDEEPSRDRKSVV